MIIQIKSNNPNFSYMLAKNPNSGLQGQGLRKGALFHYFINPEHYVIYFEDNYDSSNISYPKMDKQKEYLDKSPYISSYILFDCLSTLLNHCLKPEVDQKYLKYDPTGNKFNYELECILEVRGSHNLDIFKRYCENDFGQVNISYEKIHPFVYKINFKSTNFFNLIKIVFIFAVYNSIFNRDKIQLQNSFIEKIVDIINQLDAPFFIRYLIKKNMIFSKKVYEKVKDKLQQSSRYEIKFVSQNEPWEIRYNFIFNNINTTVPLVIDWGFGEGKMLKRFNKIFDKIVGVEIDDDMIERLKWRIENREDYKDIICIDYKNANEISKLDTLTQDYNSCIVVLAEVIEHLSDKNSCINLLKYIITTFSPEQILITTPNREFNKYLGIKEGLRHEDHKFELSMKELVELLQNVTSQIKAKYAFSIQGIGDMVDDHPMWFGVKIVKI
jgi:2-polyprenyl-3-methyl-5-hydroxy-6-metoxy-1,4-benzoquinol methylase